MPPGALQHSGGKRDIGSQTYNYGMVPTSHLHVWDGPNFTILGREVRLVGQARNTWSDVRGPRVEQGRHAKSERPKKPRTKQLIGRQAASLV